MPTRRCLWLTVIAVASNCATVSAPAATGSVELELIGDVRGSAMAFQEWGQLLSKAGIRNVRFRTAQDSASVKVDVQGSKERPIYLVSGIVSSDTLILPGARFKRNEVGRLSEWIQDLAEHGPADRREPKVAMGLSVSQFESVRGELAAPVDFSTQGMTGDQVVEKIVRQLKSPPKIEGDAVQSLANETIHEELSSISCGTALAYVLQSAGYCLTFRESGGALVGSIAKARAGLDAWPIGISDEDVRKETLPTLLASHNVNVQDVPAADALNAIAGRLKMPVLIDRRALSQQKIDPAQVKVSIPPSKMSYHAALQKLLFQARLKYEIRCDEARKPFLWVTTLKPAKLNE